MGVGQFGDQNLFFAKLCFWLSDLCGNNIVDAPSRQASQWNVCRFQIVTLLEMLRFRADLFVVTGSTLAALREVSAGGGLQDHVLQENVIESVKGLLVEIRDDCASAGLKMSVLLVDNFVLNDKTTYSDAGRFVHELGERITDELTLCLFMQVPTDRASYYADTPQFGDKVSQKFPKAVTDIQEAAKCYATGRSTASVFHLMRVMEHAVQFLGKKLGISLVGQKNWHQYS